MGWQQTTLLYHESYRCSGISVGGYHPESTPSIWYGSPILLWESVAKALSGQLEVVPICHDRGFVWTIVSRSLIYLKSTREWNFLLCRFPKVESHRQATPRAECIQFSSHFLDLVAGLRTWRAWFAHWGKSYFIQSARVWWATNAWEYKICASSSSPTIWTLTSIYLGGSWAKTLVLAEPVSKDDVHHIMIKHRFLPLHYVASNIWPLMEKL
jgi:hypothetical protein